uniref:Tegumental protein 31.8 kDa n=1 Tax=Clonorchis sinensis TaxID=79923 RepID=A0T1W3_CLOSI|nr:tegumental protein 31.8 kDa [Clonorchis sinensis]
MDAFIEAFYAIDVDRSETITLDELRNYMEKNNMDPAFIERWQEIFDPEHTGSITLNSFCEVLGLELNNIRGQFDAAESVKQSASKQNDDDEDRERSPPPQNGKLKQDDKYDERARSNSSESADEHNIWLEQKESSPLAFVNGDQTKQTSDESFDNMRVDETAPFSALDKGSDDSQKKIMENGLGYGNGYEEISVDIGQELKTAIVHYAIEGLGLHQEDRELVKWLKQRMDKEHGRLWHCTIVRGQYFSFYSYQPGHSFCFKIGPRIFIIFKTPYY